MLFKTKRSNARFNFIFLVTVVVTLLVLFLTWDSQPNVAGTLGFISLLATAAWTVFEINFPKSV